MSNEVFYPEGTTQQQGRGGGMCHINALTAPSALKLKQYTESR